MQTCLNLGDLHRVTNSACVKKTLSLPFQFLTVLFAVLSWLHHDGKWERRGTQHGHRAASPSPYCFSPQAHRPGYWGVHNHGKSLSPVFPMEVTKKIPGHTIIDNYQMPKNDNHLSRPFLSNMCSPPAKCAAHVAAAYYKNRFKNNYFYHLRTNLCSQLLNSNTTSPDLLRRSIAIQLGSRERHLKLCCRVLSISYRKKGRVQNVQTLCQSMPGAAWLVNKGGTERRFSSCH